MHLRTFLWFRFNLFCIWQGWILVSCCKGCSHVVWVYSEAVKLAANLRSQSISKMLKSALSVMLNANWLLWCVQALALAYISRHSRNGSSVTILVQFEFAALWNMWHSCALEPLGWQKASRLKTTYQSCSTKTTCSKQSRKVKKLVTK